MRRMSFSLTTEQMHARTKDVTRRVGWANLAPGTELLAVEKAMGLKKGERAVAIGPIRVVSVRRERLDELVRPGAYGEEEMRREGFPGLDPQMFIIRYFLEHIEPDQLVTRIEFEHL